MRIVAPEEEHAMDNRPAYAAQRFDPILSDISRRLDALNRDYRRLSISEIVRQADDLRHIGLTHGLDTICRLAGALNDAVSRDGRAAIIPAYLESLREAAWSDPRDSRAGDVLMAAVSVRLAS
jgi:hypothetical protein